MNNIEGSKDIARLYLAKDKKENIMKWILAFLLAFSMVLTLPYEAEAANLLSDPGFEEGPADAGNKPGSAWDQGWWPDASGSQAITTASRKGLFGLWMYTALSCPTEALSLISQDLAAAEGEIYTGNAYLGTPEGYEWAAGSYVCVRVQFLSAAKEELASYDSAHLNSSNTPFFKPYSVTTEAAPAGTTYVRFMCYLNKPDGVTGQSIAIVDDCSLESGAVTPGPELSVDVMNLGFGNDLTELQINIRNTGGELLDWNIVSWPDWASVSSPIGNTDFETDTVNVYVDRSGLTRRRYEGVISIISNDGNRDIGIYMETLPAYAVPSQPSIVTTDGYQLVVQKRLPDGNLAEPEPYVIEGVVWSPSGIFPDIFPTYDERRDQFYKWHRLDIQLIREMNANTVYVYFDFGTDPSRVARAMEILDYCYYNGIMAIMTVDEHGTNNTVKINEAVNAFKNHPAILMWSLGHEWNLDHPSGSGYYYWYATLNDAADAMQAAAQQIKGLDTNHPVCSMLSDITIPSLGEISDVVNIICTDVDIWATNVYRGAEFYAMFDEWQSITLASPKPLFPSEYGADTFRMHGWWPEPTFGEEDQPMQAERIQSLWMDLNDELSAHDPSRVCAGGTVLEWNDGWWKDEWGGPHSHDLGGYETFWNPEAQPDGFANEEWFGLVTKDRERRDAYYVLQGAFSANDAPLPAENLLVNGVDEGYFDQGDLSFTWSFVDEDIDGTQGAYQVLITGPVDEDTGKVPGGISEYNTTIVEEGTFNWKVKCWDDSDAGGQWTDNSHWFVIDMTSPAISIDGVVDGGTYQHDVMPVITIIEEHLDAFTCTLNGIAFISGTVISADGVYALFVEAIDKAGNVSSVTVNFTIGDIVPDQVEGLRATVNGRNVTLGWNTAGNDMFAYYIYRDSIKIGQVSSTENTYFDEGLAYGTYTYQVSAVNATGEGPLSDPIIVNVTRPLLGITILQPRDRTRPAINYSQGYPAVRVRYLSMNLIFHHFDEIVYEYGVGAAPAEWYAAEGDDFGTISRKFYWDISDLPSGAYTFMIRGIRDGVTVAMDTVIVHIGDDVDLDAPVTALTGEEDIVEGVYHFGTGALSFTVEDPLDLGSYSSGIAWTRYRLNGIGDWIYWDGDNVILDEGTYAVEFQSEDNAGNTESVRKRTVYISAEYEPQLFFLAKYDVMADADFAMGSVQLIKGGKLTTGDQGIWGGEALSEKGRGARYDSIDNIDAAVGTMMMWVKPNWTRAGRKGRYFFNLKEDTSNNLSRYNINLVVFGNKGTTVQIKDMDNNYYEYNLDAGPESGRWYAERKWTHLAVSWDAAAGLVKVYIDGQLRADFVNNGWIPNEQADFWVGNQRNTSKRAARSRIDDFKIFNRMLTEERIRNEQVIQR